MSEASATKINLRHATFADLDLLRHWDDQPHVIASDPNDDHFLNSKCKIKNK